MSHVVKLSIYEQVLLGPYSADLLDCLFMKPSPQTTLLEFFPTDTFGRDEELVAQSRGIQYLAWRNDRIFASDNLPVIMPPTGTQEARVDVAAVIKTIRDTLARK
ncbi:hypothetical protein H0H87_005918 [Tephrocybe sp. NHM501043]|nr:hypothetical protein H0H87_005918 [Tephrocybe sp. NHM501043]